MKRAFSRQTQERLKPIKFIRPSNPFKKVMFQQNYGANMYTGFTGSTTEKVGGSTQNSGTTSTAYLKEFYRLPSLSKSDQMEIISELT